MRRMLEICAPLITTVMFSLPREEAAIVQDYQRLSSNLGLNSWAAFASSVHHETVLTDQFLLLADEVNPVLDVVLDAGLDVTGVADSCSFDGPHLHTIDVTGRGSFRTLDRVRSYDS